MEKIFCIVEMAIAAGAEDRFRVAAPACMAAARADLTGTSAYEWFLAEDGRHCTVIEIYDGADAIAHHSRTVGATIPPLLDIATFSLEFAGDVPDAVIDRMRARLGDARMNGPRFQGLLTEAATGQISRDAGTMIFAVARFSILPGRHAEFRELAAEAFGLVQANEPGTIGYEWFLDGDECLTVDIYRDAAALAAHMANAGPTMAKILRIVESDTRIYGALPEAMRGRFKPELGVRYIAPQLQGVM